MNLDDILYAWRMQYGSKGRSGMRYIPRGTRFLLYCHLIRTLKEKYEYTKESFTAETIQRIVDGSLLSRHVLYGERRDRDVRLATDEVKRVLFKYFNAESKVDFLEDPEPSSEACL